MLGQLCAVLTALLAVSSAVPSAQAAQAQGPLDMTGAEWFPCPLFTPLKTVSSAKTSSSSEQAIYDDALQALSELAGPVKPRLGLRKTAHVPGVGTFMFDCVSSV
jgi:hypothetical protein